MEIDQRIIIGISLIALLISVFAYKEILDVRSIVIGTPTPSTFESMMRSVHFEDTDDEGPIEDVHDVCEVEKEE